MYDLDVAQTGLRQFALQAASVVGLPWLWETYVQIAAQEGSTLGIFVMLLSLLLLLGGQGHLAEAQGTAGREKNCRWMP